MRYLSSILIFSILYLFCPPSFGQETVAPLSASLNQSYQTDLMTGQALVSVPIAVAPGRKSIQPNLVLNYSSNSPNGTCGVGWNLEMGLIQRNTKYGVPQYNHSDFFIASINGAKIELVDIGGNEYRAKQEGAFLKFSIQGSLWQVKDKSGITYYFGSTANSRQEDAGRVFSWYLDKIIDLNGNYLNVAYFHESGQVYPERISYTGKEGGALPKNAVEFIYEPRADIISSYRGSFLVKTNQRLCAIDITADNQRVGKYLLSYSYSPATARSILISLTQYGKDGLSALLPVNFEYQSKSTIGE